MLDCEANVNYQTEVRWMAWPASYEGDGSV